MLFSFHFIYQLQKFLDINGLNGPGRRHAKMFLARMAKNHVTGPLMDPINPQAVGNASQVLNPPITGIAPHLGKEFLRRGHAYYGTTSDIIFNI
jgi:hypothetical protein